MDFELPIAIISIFLGVLALYLSFQNKKSLAFRAFTLFDLFALLLPCSLNLMFTSILPSAEEIKSTMYRVVVIFNGCSFGIIFHFLQQHHPTNQLNARRTLFLIFLTVLLMITFLEPQIETGFQSEGMPTMPGLYTFLAVIPYYGYLSYEGIIYSIKTLKPIFSTRKVFIAVYFVGIILAGSAVPISIFLNIWFFSSFVYNFVFLFSGAGTFIMGYCLREDIIFPFIIPNQILELGVFDKSGRELFFYRFQENVVPTEMKPGIIIGLQSLLSSLVSEPKSQHSGEVEEIKLKDRFILFDYSKHYEFFIIIILTAILPYIKTILQSFLREFEKKFGDILVNLQNNPAPVDSEKFKDATKIINRIFTSSK